VLALALTLVIVFLVSVSVLVLVLTLTLVLILVLVLDLDLELDLDLDSVFVVVLVSGLVLYSDPVQYVFTWWPCSCLYSSSQYTGVPCFSEGMILGEDPKHVLI